MYEEYYHLRERPFTLLPDPDYLYLSPAHKLARAYLEYGIKQRIGFVVLTGEIGTGKTTLIKSLLKSLKGKQQRIGVLYQTSFAAEDLLELLLREFGIRGNYTSRAARLAAFNQFLLLAYRRGEHVVLIVDEAQNLGPEALEEIRLLSNLQTEKETLLQVIIVGQPSLRERLRQPALRQLAQRVAVHYHLRALDLAETKEYVHFRLSKAGGNNIFSDSAIEKLYAYTKGVPRRLNAWCDLALVAGFAEGRQEIDGDFIDVVVAAQGGALEGPEETEAVSSDDTVEEAVVSRPAVSGEGNHLKAEVLELAARLSRLEGLVLEMTGQLVPLISKFLSMPSLPEISLPAEDLSGQQENQSDASAPDNAPKPREGWWQRFWKN